MALKKHRNSAKNIFILSSTALINKGFWNLPRIAALLARNIRRAWNEHKQETNITKIANNLLASSNPAEQELGDMLYPYTKDGEYGRFFEGKATVSFTKSLSVIEFEELKNRKDLQKVVVQILMIQITNQMLGEKRQLFQIIMDEAWDLLRGKETGDSHG